MNPMYLALGIFLAMYILLLVFGENRYLIALATAVLFVFLGFIKPEEIIPAINWNVIMMLTGTMVIVSLFSESRMPTKLSEMLLHISPNVKVAVILLSLFAGIISAFVDNVATVLMIAPVALAVTRQLNINPVPVIISIAVSSNLQGAATLVGDTTSILLGEYANMNFNEFFWFKGKPSIFFAVELGALLTIPILAYIFRKEKGEVDSSVDTVITDYVPTILLLGVIVGLITASQLPNKPALINGYICMGLALIGLVYETIKHKSIEFLFKTINDIDFKTLLLLMGLFVVIEGVTNVGVISAIRDLFVSIAGDNKLFVYVLIVAMSVFFSAFIDNIPYVATMLPVVKGIANILNMEPYLLYFGLLIGATLGGNLTPIGASANIAGIGILEKNGHEVKTSDFLRIGVPFTMTAVISGALLMWLIWS